MTGAARLRAAIAATAVAAAAAGCAGGGRPVEGIVLITLDTTRADRLGCYGYARGATPNLDRLAAEGVRFEEAQSSVPVTLPSHATMFTGLYPAHHGVRYNGMFKLPGSAVTVAELLTEAGWETAGFPASYPLTATTGIGQGFGTYRDLFSETPWEELGIEAERKANEITDLALEWLDRRPEGRPFFVWAHYFDPHAPYAPPFPYSATYRERPYDGEIAFMDAEVGRLLAGLRERGLADGVLVIVAGDHGEGLFDHGEKMHANLAYQSTLRVPLLARGPGVERGSVVDGPVALADLGPTILDYAGVAGPPMDGVSLRPFLEGGQPPPRDLYVESLSGSLVFGWSPIEGVRRGDWKYLRSIDPELFDLAADPGETTNLYRESADRAADMDAALAAMLSRWQETADAAEVTATPLDGEEMARLASLGYVGGTVSAERRGGPSPRDLIHLESAILYAGTLMSDGDFEAALRQWRVVLEADPTNRQALSSGAIAASRVGERELAERWAAELVATYPEFVPGHVTLGENRIALGNLAGATAAFRAGLEANPGEPALAYRLAVARLKAGDLEEALAVAREALERGGESYFRVVVAAALAGRGESGAAEAELARAVADGYARRDVLTEEPSLETLRRLPRFEEIVAAIPEEPEGSAPARDAGGAT